MKIAQPFTNAHAPASSDCHLHSPTIPIPLPPRPPRPPIYKTAVYKSVGDITINVDIYMQGIKRGAPAPVMLYIHGGGWVGSNRADCSRLVLIRFLEQRFVACSMDYRLLPESNFEQIQEDVRDIELWPREKL